MAHSRSAKKRVRQNEKLRLINQMQKSALKTQTRRFTDALGSKDLAAAEQQYRLLTKKLDQVAAKGTIHSHRASRLKSRLHKRLNTMRAHASA